MGMFSHCSFELHRPYRELDYRTDKMSNRNSSPSLQTSNAPQDPASTPASSQASSITPSTALSSAISPNSNAAYTPLPPSSVPRIDTSCPYNLRLKSWTNDTYTCAQLTDVNAVGDITGLIAYTVQACVDACSSLNRVQSAKVCVAVAVNDMLAGDYAKQGANCFLKNITEPKTGNTGVTLAVLDQ